MDDQNSGFKGKVNPIKGKVNPIVSLFKGNQEEQVLTKKILRESKNENEVDIVSNEELENMDDLVDDDEIDLRDFEYYDDAPETLTEFEVQNFSKTKLNSIIECVSTICKIDTKEENLKPIIAEAKKIQENILVELNDKAQSGKILYDIT